MFASRDGLWRTRGRKINNTHLSKGRSERVVLVADVFRAGLRRFDCGHCFRDAPAVIKKKKERKKTYLYNINNRDGRFRYDGNRRVPRIIYGRGSALPGAESLDGESERALRRRRRRAEDGQGVSQGPNIVIIIIRGRVVFGTTTILLLSTDLNARKPSKSRERDD